MTNNSTPDPAEQAARDQWQAWLDQAPAAHWSGYGIVDASDGHQILAVIHTTEAERKRILRALYSERIPLPSTLVAGMKRLREIGRRGPQPGPTHDPDFLAAVVEQAWEERELEKRLPSIEALILRLGIGRTTYTDWLRRNHLTSADIKLAAQKRTTSDGLSYLRGVQRKRRRRR